MDNGLIFPSPPALTVTEARIWCVQTELHVEGSGNAPIVHRERTASSQKAQRA
eukprot:UN0118